MIRINTFPSSFVNKKKIKSRLSKLLDKEELVGGLYNKTNLELSTRFGLYLNNKVTLTSSGTNAALIAIDYAIKKAKDKKIHWLVSEYMYFSLCSFLLSRKEPITIIPAGTDEVTLDKNFNVFDNDSYYIVLVTNHNNKITPIPDSVLKLQNKFIIQDKCVVFGNKDSYASDIDFYSFSNNKMLVGGEGGCLSSSSEEFHEHAAYRTFNGILPTRNIDHFMYFNFYTFNANPFPFKASISGLVSLLLIEQLNVIDTILEKRKDNYQYICKFLDKSMFLPVTDSPLFFSVVLPSSWSFKKIQQFQIGCFRDGIQSMMGVVPYDKTTLSRKRIINLPIHTELNRKDLKAIATSLIKNYES
jgi:hypothetical protein